MMSYNIRDFHADDAASVNAVALAAFSEYQSSYSDWQAMSRGIGAMSSLVRSADIIVASRGPAIVGAVAYVGPGKPKMDFFKTEWPIIRMLVVDPQARGHGIGRSLTEECIRRAQRDRAQEIALHTSPIMKVALPMYVRMGFRWIYDAPPILGVPYGVYVKALDLT